MKCGVAFAFITRLPAPRADCLLRLSGVRRMDHVQFLLKKIERLSTGAPQLARKPRASMSLIPAVWDFRSRRRCAKPRSLVGLLRAWRIRQPVGGRPGCPSRTASGAVRCEDRTHVACRSPRGTRGRWSIQSAHSGRSVPPASRWGPWLRRPIPPIPHAKRQLLTLRRHNAPSRTVPRCAKCEGQCIESRQICFGIAFGGECVRPSAIRSAMIASHRIGRRSAAARSAGGRGAVPLGRPTASAPNL